MKYIFILFTLLFFNSTSYCQTGVLNPIKNSKEKLIYTLSSEQAETLLNQKNKKWKDLKQFQTTIYDTIDFNTHISTLKYPYGHYLMTYLVNDQYFYHYFQQLPFDIIEYATNENIELEIVTPNGNTVTTANVFQGSKQIAISPNQRFAISRSNKQATAIKISFNKNTYFYTLKDTHKPKWNKEDIKENNQLVENYGYLAINKPKFKYGDTVKTQIYVHLLNDLIDDSLDIYLDVLNTPEYKQVLLGRIGPKNGVYNFDFVLADSIPLNSNIQISTFLNRKKKKDSFSLKNTFYTEDYQLKEVKYTVDHKGAYKSSDTISIKLNAKTINGIPAQNIQYEVDITPKNIINTFREYDKISLIPFTSKGKLNEKGEADFAFNSFSKTLHATYTIHVKFWNSEGEIKIMESNFSVIPKEFSNLDSLYNRVIINDLTTHVQFKRTGTPNAKEHGTLIQYNTLGDSSVSAYQLGDSLLLIPTTIQYALYTHKDSSYFSLPYSMVNYTSDRTADSLTFNIENPRKINLKYSLYCNKTLIEEGEGEYVSIKLNTNPKDNYNLYYEYYWRHIHKSTVSLNLLKQKLFIEAQLPETTSPGNELNIPLKITDASGKPVNNVHVLSNAVNDKLEENNTPASIRLNTKYTGPYTPNPKANSNEKSRNKRLSTFDKTPINEFDIKAGSWYDFVYGNTLIVESFDSLPNNSPMQLSINVFNKTKSVPIKYILIDSIPVFSAFALRPLHSYPVEQQAHTIQVRTEKYLYTLRNVTAREFHKLSIAIHEELYEHTEKLTRIKYPKKLSKEEQDFMLDHLLFAKSEDYHIEDIKLSQGYKDHFSHLFNKSICLGPFNKDVIYLESNFRDTTQNRIKHLHREAIKLPSKGNFLAIQAFLKAKTQIKPFVKKEFRTIKKSLRKAQSTLPYDDVIQFKTQKHSPVKQRPILSTFPSIINRETQKGALSIYFKHTIPESITLADEEYRIYNGTVFSQLNNGELSILLTFRNGRTQRINNINIEKGYMTLLHISDTSSTEIAIESKLDTLHSIYQNQTYIHYTPINKSELVRQRYNRPLASPLSGFSKFHYTPKLQYTFNPSFIYHEVSAIANIKSINPKYGFEFRHQLFFRRNEYNYWRKQQRNHRVASKFPYAFIGWNYSIYSYKNTPYVNNSIGLNYQQGLKIPDFIKNKVPTLKFYLDFSSNYNLNHKELDLNRWYYPVGVGFKYEFARSSRVFVEYNRVLNAKKSNSNILNNFNQFSIGLSYNLSRYVHRTMSNAEDHWGGGSYNSKSRISATSASPGKNATVTGLAFNETEFDKDSEISEDDLATVWKPQNAEGAINDLKSNEVQTTVDTRNFFNDEGYWIPAILTDENGEATLSIKYPDNITSWRSYVLATHPSGRVGIVYDTIKSYLPLYTEVKTPRFLIKGDSTNFISKTTNLTKDTLQLTSQYTINNKLYPITETSIGTYYENRFPYIVISEDTVAIKHSAITKQFGDAEERQVPVFPQGLQRTEGNFWALNNDTSVTYTPVDTLGEVTIYLENSLLSVMLDEIEKVEHYPYGCNEQLASKLSLLLSKKRVFSHLQKEFSRKDENNIKKMIEKLEDNQLTNGAWSWWGNDSNHPSYQISAHVTSVLHQCRKEFNYTINTLPKAIEHLKRINYKDPYITRYQTLNSLLTLAEMGIKIDYKQLIDTIKTKEKHFNDYEQLQVVRINQLLGNKVDLNPLTTSYKQTFMGGVYWGNETRYWYRNRVSQTLLAYKILNDTTGYETLLDGISNYILSRRGDRWRNTAESSTIVETLLPNLLKGANTSSTEARFEIDGAYSQTITELPARFSIDSLNGSIKLSKYGLGKSFACISQSIFDTNPEARTKDFIITSELEQNGNITDSLTKGSSVKMTIDINARAAGNYIMAEIPIPAGCSYTDNKTLGKYEIHREYHKEKLVVFYEDLPQGKHQITLELEPRYSGKYILNPSKIELMYFPVFYGNNEIKQTVIK